MIIVAVAVAFIFLSFVAGYIAGGRRIRDDYAEQLRTEAARQKLREHHRVNAEFQAYRKIDLRPRPILDGEVMKVSMN